MTSEVCELSNNESSSEENVEYDEEVSRYMNELNELETQLYEIKYNQMHERKLTLHYQEDTTSLLYILDVLRKEEKEVKSYHTGVSQLLQSRIEFKRIQKEKRKAHEKWLSTISEEQKIEYVIKLQSALRTHAARRLLKRTKKNFLHSKYVAQELLQTELSYINSLRTVIKVFMIPLKYASTGNSPVISEEEVATLFGNIEDVWNWHHLWIIPLQNLISEWTYTSCVAKLFMSDLLSDQSAFLESYKKYSKQQAISTSLLDDLRTTASFDRFLHEKQAFVQIDLSGLLIMPIQRIPRYSLLFKDLLKSTPDAHPDVPYIKQAIDSVNKISEAMDSVAVSTRHMKELIAIERSIQGFSNLVQNHRQFIEQISAAVAASWVKDKKEKPQVYRAEIFLFNDILLICTKIKEKDRDTSGDIESRAKYYKFEVCLFLVELNSVEKIEDRKEESGHVIIVLKTNMKHFVIKAKQTSAVVKRFFSNIVSNRERMLADLLNTTLLPKQLLS